MALLKKIHPDWQPSENRGLDVGGTMEFGGPFEELVKSGMAILVDSEGNELELPNQVVKCPICFSDISGLLNFVDHVSIHGKKNTGVKAVEKIAEEEVNPIEDLPAKDEPSADDLKAKRLAAMAEGRRKAAERKAAEGK